MVREPGSFRDPAGFVFVRDGVVYRQVNAAGAASYDQLLASGLYDELSKSGRLVAHTEVPSEDPTAHRLLRPDRIPFISYPYEWSFSQLKAAAKLTLSLQRSALARGMVLRDASAYNVQHVGHRPVFIDTLSFGPYVEGEPWVAYGQFCRHFLAPLALMARVDVDLLGLTRVHIDGVPLPLASKLLPWTTWLRPGLLLHLHLHARSTVRHADDATESAPSTRKGGVSKNGLIGLIDTLEGVIDGLSWTPTGTEWADYYASTNYTADSHAHKSELVGQFLAEVKRTDGALASVWDLGANTGKFSAIAAEHAEHVVSWDVDAGAVERHARKIAQDKNPHILPLLQDLTNPSPGLGWGGEERASFAGRASADVVMALALIHHLALSNNVPLDRVAGFLARLGRWAIIEMVPKQDSQVRRLLATREDIFPDYTVEGFERAVDPYFTVHTRVHVRESDRVLYLLRRRE